MRVKRRANRANEQESFRNDSAWPRQTPARLGCKPIPPQCRDGERTGAPADPRADEVRAERAATEAVRDKHGNLDKEDERVGANKQTLPRLDVHEEIFARVRKRRNPN